VTSCSFFLHYRRNTLSALGYVNDNLSDEQLQKLVAYYCSGGVVFGDHAAAAAGADPSFYSMHGTLERYLQLVRLSEKFTDESWPDRHSCLFGTQVHPYSEYCVGHYEDDMLLFGSIDGNKFTNVEYYSYLDPRKNKLSYVYDNFKFEHCDELGYNINEAAQP
jgi:hypothetical protein